MKDLVAALVELGKHADKISPDAAPTVEALRGAGVPFEAIADILNDDEWNRKLIEKHITTDELQKFHDSLCGRNPNGVEFHNLVLWLVDRGHTLSEAVTEIKKNRAFVERMLLHYRYREAFRSVLVWQEKVKDDKLTEARRVELRKKYL